MWREAVGEGDKHKVAGMVRYPLLVNRGKRHELIKTSARLMAEYDRVFTAPVRQAIERQSAECLFANWQGVMIGNGEVWFEELSAVAVGQN